MTPPPPSPQNPPLALFLFAAAPERAAASSLGCPVPATRMPESVLSKTGLLSSRMWGRHALCGARAIPSSLSWLSPAFLLSTPALV